ncbi:MAG: hypothetical protein KGH75_06275 [Rhodospirillales bacterium]|nr:hypothetical protein [Rhodospirillales bacterium]
MNRASQEVAAYWREQIRMIQSQPAPGPRAWAEKLRAREKDGEALLPVQRAGWRIALGAPRE